ncbi:hypothetical protein ILUMI_21469 [Ignelater luminosus]|uniref:DUF4817 domain-containing protein n=1 Tax=Ignelater luminosus TaxID=2038154 RepID=A0A8K0CHP4_IGNLU|nr:hypothetical protein ILUMI_21469 [Ignelater luminosus]
MAARYTYAEQTDMLLVLGFCEENLRQSSKIYKERFPNRYVPNYRTLGDRLEDDPGASPVIMPTPLNGVAYLNFLQNTLPDLMDDLPLDLRANMRFLHDGAPPHFTLNV